MKFSIHNYKEWMAVYIDGGLSREDRLLVDSFLQKHPQLMDDYLKELEEFSLVPEKNLQPSFKELEIIIVPTTQINQYNFTDYFISYHEGLLSSVEQKELEHFLQLNPKLEKEFKVYGVTQLVPDLNVQYADKKSLYKKSRPVVPLYIRYSAAASILIIISLVTFWPTNKKSGIAVKDSGNTNIPSVSVKNNVIETNQQVANHVENDLPENDKDVDQKQNRSIQTTRDHDQMAKVEMIINTPVTISPEQPSIADIQPEMALKEFKSTIVVDDVANKTVAEDKPKKKGLLNKLFSGEKTYIEDYVNATFTAFNGGSEDNKWVLKVDRDKNGKSKRVKFTSPIFSAKSSN